METAFQFIKRKHEQFKKDLEKQKTIKMKDIGRKGKFHFIREAWTFMKQHNLEEKVFVIERLRKDDKEGEITHQWNKGEIEYRIGYYIISKNGKTKNKWVWGQFCPLVPDKDLKRLYDKACKEGTIK